MSNVRLGQYLVWQLNNKKKGKEKKALIFFLSLFLPEWGGARWGRSVDKPFINQGGGAITGVRVILITAVFVDGDGPVATEEFSARTKKKKLIGG